MKCRKRRENGIEGLKSGYMEVAEGEKYGWLVKVGQYEVEMCGKRRNISDREGWVG